MTKTEERDRLRGLLFEDAPSNCKYAARDEDGEWFLYVCQPIDINDYRERWVFGMPFMPAKNQPETFLDWKETLISRHEHED